MAIPFVVEDDTEYEEAVLQQHYSDLFNLIQQIELIQRSRRTQRQVTPRVRQTPSTSTNRRNRGEIPRESVGSQGSTSAETPVNWAVALLPAGFPNDFDAILRPQNLATPSRRRRRRRTRSEHLFGEENKPVNVSVSVEVTNRQWKNQVIPSQASSRNHSTGSESLLSKLVPTPFSGHIWTAVICIVGWHLLRTR